MRTRKLFATAATGALLLALAVVPAAADTGTTTVTLSNTASTTGALTITPTLAIPTVAATDVHVFTAGATVVKDTRGSATSVNLQLSVGNFGAGVLSGGSLSALTFGGCYDTDTDTVLLGSVAAATGANCANLDEYATLSGTAATIATVTNDSGLSEVSYIPEVRISGLSTVANDEYTFDITHTAI